MSATLRLVPDPSERAAAFHEIEQTVYSISNAGLTIPDEDLDGIIALQHEIEGDYYSAYNQFYSRKRIREEAQKRGISEDDVRAERAAAQKRCNEERRASEKAREAEKEAAKQHAIKTVQHETGFDRESARLLYHYRRDGGHSLYDHERELARALEEQLAVDQAKRVVAARNGGEIDWDVHDARRERARQGNGAAPAQDWGTPGAPQTREPTEPSPRLRRVNMANWDNEPVPNPEWTVLNRKPRRQATLFSGLGGGGKSTLELQCSAAHVLGRDWLGTMPEPGPAIFVDAEDDENVMHYRLAAITKHYGVKFADLIESGLHLFSLAGEDAVMATASRGGKIEPTPLYKEILEAAGDIKPISITIASSANVYAGNEMDRAQVQQFASLLTRMAIVSNGSVTLLSHPSLTGMATDTGLSGTTQWHNAFRARFYMKGIKPEDGEEQDNDLREIVFKKNNYGPISESIVVRYNNGLFLPVPGVGSLDRAAQEMKADEIFLDLLYRFTKENRNVGTSSSRNYAPALFAREDEAKHAGITSKALEAAMRRLFAAGKIWNENYGKPSRPSYRLALKTGGSERYDAACNDRATPVQPRATPKGGERATPYIEGVAPPVFPPVQRPVQRAEADLPAGAELVGKADPGERCWHCGKGGQVMLLRRQAGEEPSQMHVDCAHKAWAMLLDEPFE
jgi:RecA-family ATPase